MTARNVIVARSEATKQSQPERFDSTASATCLRMIAKRDRAVSLFQRIKAPFGDMEDDSSVEPRNIAQAVGAVLRERREELGYDLDAIGEALRIKPVYLAALEQGRAQDLPGPTYARSEEHTSELQSQSNLVCRL